MSTGAREAGARRGAGARSPQQVLGLALVGLACVLLLVLSWGRITAPFGDSDEGINGAVWSLSARSVRELGVVPSRLGGHRLDGSDYATHPPGIVIETAVAQVIGGDHPWSSRLPAVLGTMAALVLLYRLLRSAGFEPLASGGAAALVALTPMALVYGPMLDTPVTSLPFGLLVLLCWFRDWRGERPVHPALAGLAAAAAGVSGWQAAVLTGMCGVALLGRALRHRPGAIRAALPYLIGGAVGVGLSLSWSWWVYGDFHVLFGKFGGRSGESSGIGIGDMVSFQVPWLANLLGLSLVGLVACAVALRDRALRPLAAMALLSVGVYAVIFRQAAAGHQYWNYWVLIPTAIGWAYLLRLVIDGARTSSRSSSTTTRAETPVTAAVGLVLAVVVFVGAFGIIRPDQAEGYIDDGHAAAELVDAADFPADQTTLPYVGQPYRPDAWITYNTSMQPLPITSAEQLQQLAAEHPDTLVLLLGDCDQGDASYELCSDLTRAASAEDGGVVRRARLVPISRLAPA
ncbi:MAG: ArnT family glycosyltransferase [Acidimicrobiales bacterium]